MAVYTEGFTNHEFCLNANCRHRSSTIVAVSGNVEMHTDVYSDVMMGLSIQPYPWKGESVLELSQL